MAERMAEKKGTAIRREEIVSAALTLMSSQGVRSMTIERIASIVGIVPSAVYRHFGNKSEIIAAVLTMIVVRMQRNITEAVFLYKVHGFRGVALLLSVVSGLSSTMVTVCCVEITHAVGEALN